MDDKKTMTREEFEAKSSRFMDSFRAFLEKYEEANPEWMTVTLLQIVYKAILQLKGLIENPEEKRITWENPFTELQYPVLADWKKVEPHYFELTGEDLIGQGGLSGEKPELDYSKLTEEERKARDRLLEKFVDGFITVKEVYVFRLLTKEILIVIKNGRPGYKLPVALDKKISKAPKEERARRIERKITKPARLKFLDFPIKGKRRGRAYLIFQVGPCVLSVDEKRAYYPVVIGLDFTGFKPKDLDEEARTALLDAILEGAKAAIPEENLDFLREPRPEPIVKPVSKEAPLVKVGLHAELQKFGHRPPAKQLGLFDSLLDETVKEITEKSIEVVGLDITPAQNQALFAIQKLLTKTNYRGNLPGQEIESKAFKFSGYLPGLEFSPAQYLEAYGVRKYKTSRGWEEYSGEERGDALRALIDLAKKSYLLVYRRKYWINEKGKREERIDRIETIAPLFRIIRGWEALTKYEDKTLDRGQSTRTTDEKLKAIAIEPAPILVQDIKSYFVLKPANYIQEINLLYPWPNRPSKFTFRLIDWLIAQAEFKRRHKQPLIIEENFVEIAYNLRMDVYIKTNQLKRVRQILNKSYRVAKELGYLLSHSTIQGQTKELDRLELNPEKFSRVREIEEERERLEDTEKVH
jgi:hypothetical protein